MKPKPIMPDTTMMDGTATYKKMQVEIPGIINIESDSGSHLLDVASIIFVIAVLYTGKRLIRRYIDGKR